MSRIESAALRLMFWLALLQCVPCANTALGQLQWRPGERSTVPEIDAQIQLVLTGGCWRRGESQGSYRLIVVEGGFEETFDTAYVQVMQVDLERGMETVAKTTPVAETDDGKYLITLRNVASAPSGASKCEDAVFTGRIVRRTRERTISDHDFRLRVHSDGNYSWSETPSSPMRTPHPSDAHGSGKR